MTAAQNRAAESGLAEVAERGAEPSGATGQGAAVAELRVKGAGFLDLDRMRAEFDRDAVKALRMLLEMLEAGTAACRMAFFDVSAMPARDDPERAAFRVTLRCDAPVRMEVRG